ncbi:hypothetical protein PG993_009008 [Apiospora rasikravindrae]|uniref:Uncharacterized protein n=1 Tax=Apiospora rasikravindrae TaxID=990691 RepID=A0ABR1SI81_9PEZI
MAAPSGNTVANMAAAIAAALPQKPTNPQGALEVSAGSPEIKPDPVPDTSTSSASDVAAPPPMPHTSSHRALRNGPSPQKGSGQDRFRQMISGQAIGKALPLCSSDPVSTAAWPQPPRARKWRPTTRAWSRSRAQILAALPP